MLSHSSLFGRKPRGGDVDSENVPQTGTTDMERATGDMGDQTRSRKRGHPDPSGFGQHGRLTGYVRSLSPSLIRLFDRGGQTAVAPSVTNNFPGGGRSQTRTPTPQSTGIHDRRGHRSATITAPPSTVDHDGAASYSVDHGEPGESFEEPLNDRSQSVEDVPQEEASHWPTALLVAKETFPDITLHPQTTQHLSQRKATSTRPEFLTLPISQTFRGAIQEVNRNVTTTASLKSQLKPKPPVLRATKTTFVPAPETFETPKPDPDFSVFKRTNSIWKLNLQKAQIESIQDAVHQSLSPLNYVDFLSNAMTLQAETHLKEIPAFISLASCISQTVEQLVRSQVSLAAALDIAVRDAQLGMTSMSEDEKIRLRRAPLFQEQMFGGLPATMIGSHTSAKTLDTMSKMSSVMYKLAPSKSANSAPKRGGRPQYKNQNTKDSTKPFHQPQSARGSRPPGRGGFKGSFPPKKKGN